MIHLAERHDRPFPHAVTDHGVGAIIPGLAADEFPPPTDPRWHTFDAPLERGKQEGQALIAGPAVWAVHEWLADPDFVAALGDMFEVKGLVADPARVGGGIHQSGPGARLGMHVDFNLHPQHPDLVRAVNVIVFVGRTTSWDPNWGGLLELGADRDIGIAPTGGTVVAFAASDGSWHGHPTPLAADAPLRQSIPSYYYRPVRDGEQIVARSTRFLDAP